MVKSAKFQVFGKNDFLHKSDFFPVFYGFLDPREKAKNERNANKLTTSKSKIVPPKKWSKFVIFKCADFRILITTNRSGSLFYALWCYRHRHWLSSSRETKCLPFRFSETWHSASNSYLHPFELQMNSHCMHSRLSTVEKWDMLEMLYMLLTLVRVYLASLFYILCIRSCLWEMRAV